MVQLQYGRNGRFECDVAAERIAAFRAPPAPCATLRASIRSALASPLDFPPLEQMFVPGDRVTLALDRHTPGAAELIVEIWSVLEKRGVEPEGVTILQPAGLPGPPAPRDPRGLLPREVASQVRWIVHDPTDSKQQAYLASAVRGDRIYLARDLVEADVALSIGDMRYDTLLGYAGTGSVYYPGLSSVEAIAGAHGQGHNELGPDDERPLRQLVDEVAWLLGSQFSVQVFPGAGGEVAKVLAGAYDAVFREGRKWLKEFALVHLPERVPLVVVAIDADPAGHGWEQLGAALNVARNLVVRGGKIVVLSEIDAELQDGLKLLLESPNARNVLQPLRKLAPPDLIPATQIASTADWAKIYFLSRMPEATVESLHMTALGNDREAARLLAGSDKCVLIGGAQNTFGEVAG